MAESRPTKTRNRQSESVPEPKSVSSFTDFGIPTPIVDLLASGGVTAPFPIQAKTLPDALAGRDILGRGRTGSGKTLGFVLPLVTRLSKSRTRLQPKAPRAIILAPTRELANQINDTLEPLATEVGLRTTTVYGGVSAGAQISALRRGVDVVVACPGRLLDHLRSGHLDLGNVEITVIDEADHMADLGFLPDVKRILDAIPRRGQTMLFSATLDRDVNVIVRTYLSEPLTFDVDPEDGDPHADIDHHVLRVNSGDRVAVISELTRPGGRTVIFTRTRHGATKLAVQLNKAGVPAVDLHGMLSQNARARNLDKFSSGHATTLVATDVAARGIHVDDVGLVIHADPPAEHKAYLHRSGRTARAGAKGRVVTLATGAQVRAVRQLTTKAKINPTETTVEPGHTMLTTLAAEPSGAPVRALKPSSKEPQRSSEGRNRSKSRRSNGKAGHGNSTHAKQSERRGDSRRSRPANDRNRSSSSTGGGSRGSSSRASSTRSAGARAS